MSKSGSCAHCDVCLRECTHILLYSRECGGAESAI